MRGSGAPAAAAAHGLHHWAVAGMAPRTRLQTEQRKLKLLQLPDGCLERIVALAAQGPWKER